MSGKNGRGSPTPPFSSRLRQRPAQVGDTNLYFKRAWQLHLKTLPAARKSRRLPASLSTRSRLGGDLQIKDRKLQVCCRQKREQAWLNLEAGRISDPMYFNLSRAQIQRILA